MDYSKICQEKFSAYKSRYYYITPELNDPLWNEYLREHRESDGKPIGKLPIGLFEDTHDKIVITPKDLGYDNFKYVWSENFFYNFGEKIQWGSNNSWAKEDNKNTIIKANEMIIDCAKTLSNNYKTVICNPSQDEYNPFKVSTTFYNPNDKIPLDIELVIFVYSK